MAVSGFPFEFVAHSPEPPLARFVESIWYARGTVPYRREKVAPTGSTVAVFVLGDPILETPDNGSGTTLRAKHGFLTGPHDRPTINEPTGETFAVGIVTTPVGCEAVFGLPPSGLRGLVVDLTATWMPAAALRAQLVKYAAPAEMLGLVESSLTETTDPPVAGLERCEAALAIIEANSNLPIGDIASKLGISHGHLDHEFTRIVGLTPRSLARILKMRQFLKALDVRTDIGWSELAVEHGWFDQAHLIRDFKRHTGVTPSTYVNAQRSTFSPVKATDAAGFVPEF